jgi:stalled ribosome alternative rescue factor ArfA
LDPKKPAKGTYRRETSWQKDKTVDENPKYVCLPLVCRASRQNGGKKVGNSPWETVGKYIGSKWFVSSFQQFLLNL